MTASNDVFKAIAADTSPFIVKGGWFPSILIKTWLVGLPGQSPENTRHNMQIPRES